MSSLDQEQSHLNPMDHTDHTHVGSEESHGHSHAEAEAESFFVPATPSPITPTKNTYWRSLNELGDTPEFQAALAKEFTSDNASVLNESDFSRRRFLQLMGASVVLAGAAGCWKEDKVIPDVHAQADRKSGVPQYFATTRELNGSAIGLLVKCLEGRPIKVEGNPRHPTNGTSGTVGSADVFALASTLELYDPERSREVLQFADGKRTKSTWVAFESAFKPTLSALAANGGEGLRILSEMTLSPSVLRLRESFQKAYPKAVWAEYEACGDDNVRAGATLAFGSALRTHYQFDQADLVLSLDGDPLNNHGAALRHAADYGKKRQVDEHGHMSRVYAVESTFSAIGGSADHRLPLRSEQIKPFLLALRSQVVHAAEAAKTSLALPDVTFKSDGFLNEAKIKKFVEVLAKDLVANAGKSIIYVGQRQPAEVHALAHQLNAALGNIGDKKTITYTEDPQSARVSHVDAIKTLAADLTAGKVSTLIVLGGNPVYNAPSDLNFEAALKKATLSIHLGLHEDETSKLCAWHLPQAHFLESWGDARAWDGTVSMVQPLIAPLYDGKTALEVLAFAVDGAWAKNNGEALVKETFKASCKDGNVDRAWRKALHDGIVEKSAWAKTDSKVLDLKVSEVAARALKVELAAGELEAVFMADSKVFDGRFANCSWLQELPDYISKLCWDNAAFFSQKTAKNLGIANEQVVTLTVGGRNLDVACYILPGQAQGSVGLLLGYGRTAAGSVGGNGGAGGDVPSVGFNTYKLRGSEAMDIAFGVAVAGTAKKYTFALTQDHHLIDDAGMKSREERLTELVREGTLEELAKDPKFVEHRQHVPPLESLWNEFEYKGHKWGLAVDLAACIGCNSCMTACQSENNVAVVGKEQVIKGREMHWMRLDRYYKGDIEEPEMVTQPVMCQQCENAPCEQVCPVGATMHTHEGLNDMVYNRCIGTRYCANNCPFKVRRFNWLDWNKNLYDDANESLKLSKNPDVTIRMRGVMEKCTYCVQRIESVKIQTKNAGQPITDGMITPACAQSCPTQAIRFGDLNDKTSKVFGLHSDDRAYKMLADLNVKPRTAYLARIKNPNPELVSGHTDEQHSHH